MSTTTLGAAQAVESSFDAVAADGRPGIWIDLVERGLALARAEEIDRRVAAGEHLPLAGRTMAVKGNIDVAGLDTTAGCPGYAYRPDHDAAVVRALTGAGAVVIGTTNLDQFATGLVGTRSPYGVCPNAHWDGLISGGSSSGSAVAVATGMVDLALGTDTAGSGRVPAAANGIVGLKPTRGRVSAAGVVPACASIDCLAFMARDVHLAALAMDIASGSDPDDPWSRRPPLIPPRSGPLRVGVPALGDLGFDGDVVGPDRWAAALAGAVDAIAAAPEGASFPEVPVDGLVDAGRLLYEGAFVAERYAAVGRFVDAHLDEVDPVVGSIISGAGRLPAWQLAADRSRLAEHERRTRELFERVDVLVLPTIPRVPTITEVAAEPIAVNSMLGTYTNFVNLLDLCAVTVPVPAPDTSDLPARPPTSLTLIAPAWHDATLVTMAATIAGAPASRPPR
jgi:allophanate hydrolase